MGSIRVSGWEEGLGLLEHYLWKKFRKIREWGRAETMREMLVLFSFNASTTDFKNIFCLIVLLFPLHSSNVYRIAHFESEDTSYLNLCQGCMDLCHVPNQES